jgi:hypothetical protein
MKYISVVILFVLMGWTWSMATTDRPFKLEQHKQVEAGVEQDVRAFIQKKFTTVKEIHCSQLFTEVVDPGKELIARFRCQAAGDVGNDVAEQVFEGFLKLKSEDGFQSWNETGGEIRSPEISFRNGIHISPKDKDDAEEAADPSEEKAAAPAAPAVDSHERKEVK